MAVEVRTVIAVLLGLRFKSDIDQIRLLGALHGRRRIAMRVFQHAFSRTHLQHRVADVRGVHAIAHGDVQRLGELTITDHVSLCRNANVTDSTTYRGVGKNSAAGVAGALYMLAFSALMR